MLFQRYMTGRGNLGYGFRAQTTRVPITPYLKLRASDTGDTNRMLLEIMTTNYNELAAIGSCYDREQSNGYTDILFADPAGEEEWEKVLDNPGRLLYLSHVNKTDFLEISNKGKTVSLGGGEELALPEVTHKWDQRFHMDEDMLADLVADVWYAASMRLTEAENPGNWPVINIRLTDENEWENTLEIGREFYCNVLMPALPRALRRIVSVCIGGRYGDVSNAANGGAAAVLITLPDARNEQVPGTYVITPSELHRQSLNPFQDTQSWRTFGRAVLKYAQGGLAALENEERYLSVFFAVSEQIGSSNKYQHINHLTVNWPYAFLLFNAHQNAAAAASHSGDFTVDVEASTLKETFDENVWESAEFDLLKEFGFEQAQARNCYVWLEKHVVEALLANERIDISERYEELTRRAFTLQQVRDAGKRDELLQLYEKLLLRGTAKESNNALEKLLDLLDQSETRTLMLGQRSQFALLMGQALERYEEEPSDKYLKILADYARNGDEEQNLVTDYAVELLEKDIDYRRLSVLRPVQRGEVLDHAVVEHFRNDENIERCTERDFCIALRTYAETPAGANGMQENALKNDFAENMRSYIADNASVYRRALAQVDEMFDNIGMKKSSHAMEALTDCLEHGNQPVNDGDVMYIVNVLGSEHTECADRMIGVLRELFENVLPDMFKQGKLMAAEEHAVIDTCWKECIRRTPGSKREELRAQLADCLQIYMLQKPNTLVNHLGRAVELLKAYGCTDAEKTVNICCSIFQSQITQLDEEAVLTEKDLKVINTLDFKNVSDDGKEKLAEVLHALYVKKLPMLGKGEEACEYWRACLKNKYLGGLLKGKSQQSFAEYVDACAEKLGTDAADDCLSDFLQIVESLEWERVEVVRKAVAKYFTKLERAELQESEIRVLLSMHSSLNREIEDGLCDVFSRALPRLLAGGEELGRWASVPEEIDLRDTFQKSMQQILANAKTEQKSLGEAFVLSLIDFGNELTALRPAAVAQAISIIEEHKNVLAANGHVSSRLLSEEVHFEVLAAVLNSNHQQLLNQYIDLLAYEPVDAGSADNEKLLRKEMTKMRETLFGCMNADAASYASRVHEVWKMEIQDALLKRLNQLSTTEGLTFQQLCQLPQRWAVECQNWRFVSFAELTRYVEAHEKLQAAVVKGAKVVVSRSLLTELKQNTLRGEDNWYARLIEELIAQRASMDVRMLADECETPQALEDLLTMLNETGAAVTEHTRQALNLIYNGDEKKGVLETLTALRELEEEMPLGVTLLRKAIFGRERDQWKQWNADNCSGRIPMAAICYLTGSSKDWQSFFSVIFEDTVMEKTALAEGKDPVQTLIFASAVLHDMKMDEEANKMVEVLRSWRREEYAHVRAMGRKRRELAVLKEAVVWKETGASQKLYELLFSRN